MAEDNISKDAGFWVKDNYPQAWDKFPVDQPQCIGSVKLGGIFGYSHSACGKSYCELVREEFDNNSYPYSRCTESCMKAVSGPPGVSLPPAEFNPGQFEEPGAPPPADASTKHGNHQAEVAEAKSVLESEGVDSSGPCGAFEIVKRAVSLIGDEAGYLDKPDGNNCGGFAVGIIAFPDGYIYDVLGDDGGENNPQWNPDGCGPTEGNGTCPDRYRAP